ncbi:MAG: energy-coupling factor ABC transporter ATP-binding protein [Treponema sp.]
MQKELIRAEAVSKYFPPENRRVLNNVSFSIFEHDCIAVGGKNGSGKTVLMTILAGLEVPSSGSVSGIEKNTLPKTGLVFQDANAQILGETVEEDVLFGVRHKRISAGEREKKLKEVLEKTGLSEKRYYPARSLSGGEKRRLAVAGILMIDADIIIFDEPFANLDYDGVISVVRLIQDLKQRQKTLLILTHELEKVLGLTNRLLILNNGTLTYNGSPEKALTNGVLKENGIRNPLISATDFSDLVWDSYE